MYAQFIASFCLLFASSLFAVAASLPVPAVEVVVYLRGDIGKSPALRSALTEEVGRLMEGLRYRVHWTNDPKDIPGSLIIVSAEGSCAPHSGGVMVAGEALAKTQEVGGHILPFVWVECSQLNGLLAPGLTQPSGQDFKYGRALARVLAHELFHILAQTPHHSSSGVAEPSVSGEDLLSQTFEFDEAAKATLRSAIPATATLGF